MGFSEKHRLYSIACPQTLTSPLDANRRNMLTKDEAAYHWSGYCADYRCSHNVRLDAAEVDPSPD
jgi:hypothetical protein